MRPVPVLLALHPALALTLWGRPGIAAVYLWYVGPLGLALVATALLVVALVATVRHRATWSLHRTAALAGLVLVVGAVPFYRTYPSSHDARPSAVPFRLPLDGPVTVAWGGATNAVNYHARLPDQRWAYDLLVTEQGRSHRGNGKALTDYFAFDRPVRAPAAGVIRAAHDAEPDVAPGDRSPRPAFGNYVVVEVAPGECLFIAHLRLGSVAVTAGEPVVAGQQLGRVGNSGTTSEPHVHMHLQDTPRPFLGEGIPFMFHAYRQDGRRVARGMPRGGITDGQFLGDIVEQIDRAGDEPDSSATVRPPG